MPVRRAPSKEKLERAESELPRLETFVNDISWPAERELLAEHVRDVMPGIQYPDRKSCPCSRA